VFSVYKHFGLQIQRYKHFTSIFKALWSSLKKKITGLWHFFIEKLNKGVNFIKVYNWGFVFLYFLFLFFFPLFILFYIYFWLDGCLDLSIEDLRNLGRTKKYGFYAVGLLSTSPVVHLIFQQPAFFIEYPPAKTAISWVTVGKYILGGLVAGGFAFTIYYLFCRRGGGVPPRTPRFPDLSSLKYRGPQDRYFHIYRAADILDIDNPFPDNRTQSRRDESIQSFIRSDASFQAEKIFD
jgi:hypothetical protein